MSEEPRLLQCPNCRDRRDNVNLGSVSSEGYVIFKRQFGRYTAIMSTDYSIICDCGYAIHIHEGKVTSALTVPSANG